MKSAPYKIVVFSDLKDSTDTALKSTISLAKMINGSIAFFHVKKPSEVVTKESQLSAIRSLNHEHTNIDKKIRDIVASYSKDYDIDITYSFTFGTVKDEINAYIKEHRPDIIVLGKRKSNPFNLIGDNITRFVLKQHPGVIMIAGNKNNLEPNKKLSLGILNGTENTLNIGFTDDLMAHAQNTLKSFRIVEHPNKPETIATPSNKKIVEYVFEHGANSIHTLSNYLSKNNINLLCLDRTTSIAKNVNVYPKKAADIKSVINSLNVSLLLTGDSKLA